MANVLVVDDSLTGQTVVVQTPNGTTVPARAAIPQVSGLAYQTVADEGDSLPPQPILDFQGNGVSVVNGSDRTIVNVEKSRGRIGDWCASQGTASVLLAYMNYQNPTTAASTTIPQVAETCAGVTGTLSRITIYQATAMTVASITYTLWLNGVATALAVTIAPGVTQETAIGSVAITPKDVLRVTSQQTTNESNTTIRAKVSLELT